LSCDHLVPVVRGGADGPLTVLCRRCNSALGARHDRHGYGGAHRSAGSKQVGGPRSSRRGTPKAREQLR
jgi:hypothetical protein